MCFICNYYRWNKSSENSKMNIYYFALNYAQITVYCKATIQQHMLFT